MPEPILKQFAALSPEDFERHPVWIACHVADYGEPWYDETDEETFRPYSGPFPTDTSDLLLVSAIAIMNDGSTHAGFLSPSRQAGDLANLQPHVFVGACAYGLGWSESLTENGEHSSTRSPSTRSRCSRFGSRRTLPSRRVSWRLRSQGGTASRRNRAHRAVDAGSNGASSSADLPLRARSPHRTRARTRAPIAAPLTRR